MPCVVGQRPGNGKIGRSETRRCGEGDVNGCVRAGPKYVGLWVSSYCSQTASVMEEKLNNIAGRMTCPVAVTQLLFEAPLAFVQLFHE
jgi:hypothetical protein